MRLSRDGKGRGHGRGRLRRDKVVGAGWIAPRQTDDTWEQRRQLYHLLSASIDPLPTLHLTPASLLPKEHQERLRRQVTADVFRIQPFFTNFPFDINFPIHTSTVEHHDATFNEAFPVTCAD